MINYDEFENYDLMDEVEGIHCRVLVDGCFSYIHYNHPLWVLFQNGYDEENDPWVPLTVSKYPSMVYHVELRIPTPTFNNLCRFVSCNASMLRDIAIMEKSLLYEFDELVKNYEDNRQMLLTEMANLYPSETGLKGRIWLDTGKTYLRGGHGARIKYYYGKGKNEYVSIGTNDQFPIYGDYPEGKKRDVDNAVEWIAYNLPLIDNAMDGRISDKEFKERMSRMSNGKMVSRESERYIPYRRVPKTNYFIITRPSDGWFNIAKDDDTQKPLFPKLWFQNINGMTVRGCLHIVYGSTDEYNYEFCCEDGRYRKYDINSEW